MLTALVLFLLRFFAAGAARRARRVVIIGSGLHWFRGLRALLGELSPAGTLCKKPPADLTGLGLLGIRYDHSLVHPVCYRGVIWLPPQLVLTPHVRQLLLCPAHRRVPTPPRPPHRDKRRSRPEKHEHELRTSGRRRWRPCTSRAKQYRHVLFLSLPLLPDRLPFAPCSFLPRHDEPVRRAVRGMRSRAYGLARSRENASLTVIMPTFPSCTFA